MTRTFNRWGTETPEIHKTFINHMTPWFAWEIYESVPKVIANMHNIEPNCIFTVCNICVQNTNEFNI